MSNKDMSYTQNRELSWLRFNERVMEEALDKKVPTFEKLKFLSIFTSNLDEFNMVRVGSLTDLNLLKSTVTDNKTGLSASEQLNSIFQVLPELYNKRDEIFFTVEDELRKHKISNFNYNELKKEHKKQVQDYFDKFIFPILSPQIVDYNHPFPFLENIMEYVVLELSLHGKSMLGIIPLPKSLPYFITLGNHEDESELSYILMPNILFKFADKVFSKYDILNKALISVTRNADLNADDELADQDEDYRSHMKKILKKRKRLQAVRLETNCELSGFLQNELTKNLLIESNQIFITKSPLNMAYVYELEKIINKDILNKITYKNYIPQKYSGVDYNKKIMPQIEKNTILLKFPYEEIDPFINLLAEAAEDPEVVSIKITIYRLAKNSKLVQHLVRAAEKGKDVTVLIELRARFDEQSNIDYTDILYESGCNIIYGFPGFKVHSKICLIIKQTKSEVKYITQIGTGNYNESTAMFYTDLSLISSNEEIGQDAFNFFQNMSMGNIMGTYKNILTSPSTLKPVFISLIDEEIAKGDQGSIFFKMNSLTDREIIDKLQEASNAGVKIRLIIRGICCIIPNVKGKTENIEVRSIVGRFLEHARIYSFGQGLSNKVFISSADLMTRNTERRVEVACPIFNPLIKAELIDYLETQFKDNVKARAINEFGLYEKIIKNEDEEDFSSQDYFMEKAIENAAKFSDNKKPDNFITSFLKRLVGKNHG